MKWSGAQKIETTEDFKELLELFKTCFPGWVRFVRLESILLLLFRKVTGKYLLQDARFPVEEITLDNLPKNLCENRYLGIETLVKFQSANKR